MLTFSHLPPSSPFQVIVFTVFLLGPDLLSAGTCSEKKCGALQLRRQTLFFLKKLATFFSHHRACVSFFVHSRLVVSLAGRPFFPHAKICRSFCGGGGCSAEHAVYMSPANRDLPPMFTKLTIKKKSQEMWLSTALVEIRNNSVHQTGRGINRHHCSYGKIYLQGGPKMAPFLYALTSSNINRFSKLFHCQN